MKSLQEAVCRGEARKLLASLLIEEPEEIDLDLLAWKAGRLRIESGHLGTADGRLISGSSGGVIRVRSHIKNEGRIRFIVAHEIGHHVLHKLPSTLDRVSQFSFWRIGSIEAEANWFAAELLMPKELFRPGIRHAVPCFESMDSVAKQFRASILATCFQAAVYSDEPFAVVFSDGKSVKWWKSSSGFEFRIKSDIHPYSVAHELETKDGTGLSELEKPISVPAGCWLWNFEPDGKEEIKEDSRRIPGYGTISILWIDEII